MATEIAAWLVIIVIGGSLFMLFIGNPLIDWLDARTSRITPEEARERARLHMIGKWPPMPTTWQKARPAVLTWVVIGVTWALIRLCLWLTS